MPEVGAGLARYDFIAGQRRQPLFRPCRDLARAGPFDLATISLCPGRTGFSAVSGSVERITGSSRNLDGEPLPIVGIEFSSAWDVDETTITRARLVLRSKAPGPYNFEAVVAYALSEGELRVDLQVTNRGSHPLPFGLGLHPWLSRTAGTTLLARAEVVTLENSRHLPENQVPVSSRGDWDFTTHTAVILRQQRLLALGRTEIIWHDRGACD